MAIRKVIDTDADDGSVLTPPADDDDGDYDAAHGGPAEETGVGAIPQPQREPDRSPPQRKGGRPKGSRNRTTVEREQASATGVGAPTSRPAGGAGQFPGEDAKIPIDADLLWMHVLEEIQAEGWSPYDMEIRVDRHLPLPAGPVTEFDAAAVMGDAQTSPATALRKFIRDWIHLPSGVMGPGLYVLHFCWKNKAKFFRRGELKMPGRNECLAMKASEEARQSQTGAAGFGEMPSPNYPQPRAPQQAPMQQPQAPFYGFGAPQQPSQTFDPEAERAKIRAEMDREYEMDRLRRENDELRRRPPQYAPQPQYYGNGYPSPQQRRGVGGPQQMPQQQYAPPPESEEERIARVVVSVLHQTGVVPRAPVVGVGATPAITSAVDTATGGVDEFDRAMETFTRGKKVFKKMKELFEDDEDEPKPKAKPTGAGAPAGDEEAPAKVRFQGTGQRWRDGREVMMPIDEDGEPLLPTTMATAMATGFANPFLLEPIAQGVGAVMQRVSSMMTGLGGQPQQPQRDSSIQVQQVQQQQPQQTQQFAPQQPAQMPAPTPYTPAPAAAGGGDWNLT